MSDRWARGWFAATALVAFVGVTADLALSASYPSGHFSSAAGRATNQLFYFTIQSNLIVAVTSLFLAVRPSRTSPVFRVFRMAGLVGIAITALVYHAVLAGLSHLTGWWVITNQLVHSAVPGLAIVGWLLFGPRRLCSWKIAALSLLYPALWLVITLIRGPLVGWYPYPFVDVTKLGYLRVIVNSLTIGAMFFGFAAAATGGDRWLPSQRHGAQPAADDAAERDDAAVSRREPAAR